MAIKERPSHGTMEINFVDKILFHKIKALGFPIGKKGQKLTLSKRFYDRGLVKYIVQGFFATDGSLVLTKNPNKYYPRIESQVIHKKFITQVYNYLILEGLDGHFYDCKSKPDIRWKTTQKKYKFQFNGKENLQSFCDLVGFVNPKHKKRFKSYIDYDLKYMEIIKGVSSIKQKNLRKFINDDFKKRVTVPGFKPGTSAS